MSAWFKLPTELRRLIYQHTIHTNVDLLIVDEIRETSDSDTAEPSCIIQDSGSLTPHLAWLKLMLTCKSIASEMKSFMNEEAFETNLANFSCAVAVAIMYSGERQCRRLATW